MAKTIGDYKKDYEAAKAAGDAAGMKAANDGANAIRASLGQQAQVASEDIAKVAAKSGSSPAGSPTNTAASGGNWSTGNNGYGGAYGKDANGQTDFSVLIRDAMSSGADWQQVQGLLDQRVNKAQQSGLNQYMYDDLYRQAQDYINTGKNGLYQDYWNQMEGWYADMQAQQEAANRAAVEQAVNELSGQKTGIEQSYDDLYRQLYLDRRRAEKNLPQQMAAMGITGGLAEGSALGLQTNYTDALRQGEIEKQGTLNDIDQAIANARLTGDISIAQQAAQLAMDKLSTYGNLVAQMQTQRNWADESWFNRQQADIANSQWQQSFSRQQLLDELSREDVSYDRKWQIAQHLYENTGDASAFRSLGLSDAEIAALTSSYAAALQQKRGGGSSGGSGGYKPVLTYNQVMDAVDRGNITPQVEKDYKYYMGTEYDTGDGPGDTPAENEGGLWENIKALGLGPVSASFVEELAQYGGIVEAKNGQLTWAPGWSASNYKSKLDHAKNGALPGLNLWR